MAAKAIRVHNLKTLVEPFEAVWHGFKKYEVRNDDRDFLVGDVVVLREVVDRSEGLSARQRYTGRRVEAWITYKTPGGAFGLPEGLCVLSIRVRRRIQGRPFT